MIRRCFTRWPWATSCTLTLLLVVFLIMGGLGGGDLVFPPLWLVVCAAMTPAVGAANLVAALVRPAQPDEVPVPSGA